MKYILFIGLFIIVLFLFSALKISSKISRMEEEREYQEKIDKHI